MQHDWSRLSHLQIGRYAEYFTKMQFTLLGLDVYSAEVDDRGIDFVVRQEPDRYWDVQVKSVRKLNYVFFRKDVFRIRSNLLVALTLFEDGLAPHQYLIPASRWAEPDGLFVDRDYEGAVSKPEYGLNLSRKRLPDLESFRFEHAAANIFGAGASRD
ncbi:DUF4365 domain-containing protein [Roseovarius sp. TE539]|uniref:DUF4365 domain-containing protein n=1 Tax=Roseovarius sp. TE539 TaxID=2249812 RepID=UPI000DE12C50|nr:DUF4365 domain-containing protein [Roseovarius sp. TE539]RBI67944.1 DUF4365 domain-containing protein [Roseovarius sp. TE539]